VVLPNALKLAENKKIYRCATPQDSTIITFLQISRDAVPLGLVKSGAEHQNLCRTKRVESKEVQSTDIYCPLIMSRQQSGYSFKKTVTIKFGEGHEIYSHFCYNFAPNIILNYLIFSTTNRAENLFY